MRIEDVPSVVEGIRGCGRRKSRGLYLRGPSSGARCGKLPAALEVCPTCGEGIKVSRQYKWVSPAKLFDGLECSAASSSCDRCPLRSPIRIERALMLWVGEAHYSVASFQKEADKMGISRRIAAVPKGFAVGETWVLLAHVSAYPRPCPDCTQPAVCEACGSTGFVHTPGVFSMFRPTAIEYVCEGNESADELDALVKRGIEPVRVIPSMATVDQPALL